MTNLGLVNKNPGNLRDPATGDFQKFADPNQGLVALKNDLEIKKSGKSAHIKPGGTILDLAKVWAPKSDNNIPEDWAKNVAKTVGRKPTDPWADIPTDQLAQGVQVAEGTSTLQHAPVGNLAVAGGGNIPNPNAPKSQLSHDQLVANINAMEQQGAKPQEIQGYLDSLKGSQQEQPKFPFTSQQDAQGDTGDQNVQVDDMGDSTLSRPLALEQGLGYTLSNALGTQEKNIEAQDRGSDIQTQLLQRIKEKKTRGEDTTKLQGALDQLGNDLGKSASNIGDIGTGGITNKQVLASAGEHGLAATTAYGGGAIANAMRGSTNLSGPLVEGIAQRFNMTLEEINSLSAVEKENLLTEASKKVTPSVQRGILKLIEQVKPAADIEMGTADFATRNPIASKVGGAVKGLVKTGGKMAAEGIGAGEIYKHFIK